MNYICTLLLALGIGCAFGQQTIPTSSSLTPTDSLNKAAPAATPAEKALFPQLTPQSPNIAAFNRYGEYPVNLFSGVPAIEIPLYTIQAGGLPVPITLSYHAGGHKVTDASSWVGLGWSLQPGGAVTRQLRGMADEAGSTTAPVGMLDNTVVSDPTNGTICYNEDARFYYDQRTLNQRDGERDLFRVRTPGLSNQFILRSGTDFVLLNPDQTKVAFTRQNPAAAITSSFTVTDNAGIRSVFANPENNSDGYPNAWLMSSMQGLVPTQRVDFQYYPASNYQRTHEIVDVQTIVDQKDGSGGTYPGVNTTAEISVGTSVDGLLPRTILFPGGKVEFILQAANRQDQAGKALDRVVVSGFNGTSNQYTIINQFQFLYTYFTRTGGTGSEKVLILTAVQLLDNTGAVLGTYTFAYNTATALPFVQSRAKDFWGYYNGQVNNATLIPAQSVATSNPGPNQTVINGTESVGGGIRTANESSMKAWILSQITYPTGGYTTFDFEANRDQNGTVVGGLRIRQLRSGAGGTAPVVDKTYKYGLSETGRGRLRTAPEPGYRTEQEVRVYSQNLGSSTYYSYRTRRYSSAFTGALFPEEGSPVTYVNVAEYTDDGTTGTGINGKTRYTFRDSDDQLISLANSPKYYIHSRHWDRGQLLNQTRFGTDGRRKAETRNDYTVLGSGETSDIAGLLLQARTVITGSGRPVSGPNNCFEFNEYIPNNNYKFKFGLTKLSRSETILYDDQDETKYTSQVSETDYHPVFFQPVETRSFLEGGIVLGTRMSYPQSFPPLSATINSPDAELTGIRTLQVQNAHIPLEVINFRQELPGATKYYKTGKLTTYQGVSVLGQVSGLPKQIWLAETDFNNKILVGTGDYASSAERYGLLPVNQKNQFPIDPVWNRRLTYNTYDGRGNLLNYSVENGPTTTLTYQTIPPPGGIEFSLLATQQQNSGQPSAQTSTYTYAVSLLGPATMTAPNGVRTTYEYDSFGRLARTRDKDGNILNQFTYRYATQP